MRFGNNNFISSFYEILNLLITSLNKENYEINIEQETSNIDP